MSRFWSRLFRPPEDVYAYMRLGSGPPDSSSNSMNAQARTLQDTSALSERYDIDGVPPTRKERIKTVAFHFFSDDISLWERTSRKLSNLKLILLRSPIDDSGFRVGHRYNDWTRVTNGWEKTAHGFTYIPDDAWVKYGKQGHADLPEVPEKLQHKLQKSHCRPGGMSLELSLEQTFTRHGDWDEKHKPSAKLMAQAGLRYSPSRIRVCSDKAQCVYCRVDLYNWEKHDDPLGEHWLACQREGVDCSFINWNRFRLEYSVKAETTSPGERAVSEEV